MMLSPPRDCSFIQIQLTPSTPHPFLSPSLKAPSHLFELVRLLLLRPFVRLLVWSFDSSSVSSFVRLSVRSIVHSFVVFFSFLRFVSSAVRRGRLHSPHGRIEGHKHTTNSNDFRPARSGSEIRLSHQFALIPAHLSICYGEMTSRGRRRGGLLLLSPER